MSSACGSDCVRQPQCYLDITTIRLPWFLCLGLLWLPRLRKLHEESPNTPTKLTSLAQFPKVKGQILANVEILLGYCLNVVVLCCLMFEVLTAVNMSIVVFWVVTQWCLGGGYWGTSRFHFMCQQMWTSPCEKRRTIIPPLVTYIQELEYVTTPCCILPLPSWRISRNWSISQPPAVYYLSPRDVYPRTRVRHNPLLYVTSHLVTYIQELEYVTTPCSILPLPWRRTSKNWSKSQPPAVYYLSPEDVHPGTGVCHNPLLYITSPLVTYIQELEYSQPPDVYYLSPSDVYPGTRVRHNPLLYVTSHLVTYIQELEYVTTPCCILPLPWRRTSKN
jgi:hypothetical protein